jgi:hypothetical protein
MSMPTYGDGAVKELLELVGELMSQKERRLMVYYRPQYWHLY